MRLQWEGVLSLTQTCNWMDFMLLDWTLEAFYAVIFLLPIAAIEFKTSGRATVKRPSQAFCPYTAVTFHY